MYRDGGLFLVGFCRSAGSGGSLSDDSQRNGALGAGLRNGVLIFLLRLRRCESVMGIAPGLSWTAFRYGSRRGNLECCERLAWIDVWFLGIRIRARPAWSWRGRDFSRGAPGSCRVVAFQPPRTWDRDIVQRRNAWRHRYGTDCDSNRINVWVANRFSFERPPRPRLDSSVACGGSATVPPEV